MRIDILKKGDSVINVTDHLVAVRRKSGEVDLLPIVDDVSGWWIDTDRTITIGYGSNTVSEVIDGVTVTHF